MTRTYSRDDWNAAQEAWAEGGFSPEWKEWRHLAAMRGILYPPVGTRFDSWEDDEPSQRAMIVRAMRETPGLLRAAIARSSSWGAVIGALIRERDDWREQQRREERNRVDDGEADPREATVSLRRIIERIRDS